MNFINADILVLKTIAAIAESANVALPRLRLWSSGQSGFIVNVRKNVGGLSWVEM
jgi:hypothetical protein